MKKEKSKKSPSKFKLWKEKMKATPKGKAYLKLIYWAIFFTILFIFLGVSSLITSNRDIPNNSVSKPNNNEEVVVPKTIDNMMQEIINGTYKYTYDIHVGDENFYFEGTKYDTYQEGYKNYITSMGNGVIRYYIDNTGTYEYVGSEKVLIDNFYEGINSDFLDFSKLFTLMNSLGLVRDENNTTYAVYICSDNTYNYTLNINPLGTHITDVSITSLNGGITYLLSFTEVGDN